jgi:hypothetical protein
MAYESGFAAQRQLHLSPAYRSRAGLFQSKGAAVRATALLNFVLGLLQYFLKEVHHLRRIIPMILEPRYGTTQQLEN